jgi:hypothetical protein
MYVCPTYPIASSSTVVWVTIPTPRLNSRNPQPKLIQTVTRSPKPRPPQLNQDTNRSDHHDRKPSRVQPGNVRRNGKACAVGDDSVDWIAGGPWGDECLGVGRSCTCAARGGRRLLLGRLDAGRDGWEIYGRRIWNREGLRRIEVRRRFKFPFLRTKMSCVSGPSIEDIEV